MRTLRPTGLRATAVVLAAAGCLLGTSSWSPAATLSGTPAAPSRAAAEPRADAEQVAMLKRGVAEWNNWRTAHPGVKPALAGTDFSHAALRRADLSGADLRGAALNHGDLQGANLSGANLAGALLVEADLTGADLTGADLAGAYLSGARVTGTKLRCKGHAMCTG